MLMIPKDGHALIAPSSLARTVQCNGWLQVAAPFLPVAPTEESMEGDAAHWVALQMARYERQGPPTVYPVAGGRAPNGVIIDEEMIDGGMVYLESLEGLPGEGEQHVNITRIHPTACSGTPDFRQYAANTRRLRIVDYKYGHRYVEVFRNWQLMAYAAGVMEEVPGIDEDLVTLELVVVQPRSYHKDGPIRTWVVEATDIRAFIAAAFHAAHSALDENPKTRTGPECLDCPARHACITHAHSTYNAVEVAGDPGIMLHDAGDIGRELRLLHAAEDRLKARITGLEEQAIAKLKAGEVVPFYKLGATKPHQRWSAPVQEVIDMIEMLNPSLTGKVMKPLALVTPKQAIKAGVDAAVIQAYSFNPPGAMKLEEDSLTTASKVFS